MNGQAAVISALTFSLNPRVARAALAAGISYFDLTEDVETTRVVRTVVGSGSARPNLYAAMRAGSRFRWNRRKSSGSEI